MLLKIWKEIFLGKENVSRHDKHSFIHREISTSTDTLFHPGI